MPRAEEHLSTRAALALPIEALRSRIAAQKRLAEEDKHGAFVHLADAEAHGPSIGVKDTICVAGMPLTACSRLLEGHIAAYDATAWSRLAAETTILGKTSCDSFACGSSGATSDFGPTLNAHDPMRVPGGSSGGSATALALGLVDLALGTDTFGSARAPASFSGVVGMRPTYGLVSRRGLLDLCMSLDTIAPMARDVYGVAWLLSRIAGEDDGDLTTAGARAQDFTSRLDEPIAGKRIALLREGFDSRVDPRVAAVVMAAAKRLDASFTEASLPVEDIVKAYYILMPAEFASSMQRYDGLKYGAPAEGARPGEAVTATRDRLAPELKRRILIGTAVTMKDQRVRYHARAKAVFADFGKRLDALFEDVDFIIAPTMPCLPWKIGEHADPLQDYMADVLTGIAPAGGLPAISVPCGRVDGLPVGLQVIGRRGSDAELLRVAREVEACSRSV